MLFKSPILGTDLANIVELGLTEEVVVLIVAQSEVALLVLLRPAFSVFLWHVKALHVGRGFVLQF